MGLQRARHDWVTFTSLQRDVKSLPPSLASPVQVPSLLWALWQESNIHIVISKPLYIFCSLCRVLLLLFFQLISIHPSRLLIFYSQVSHPRASQVALVVKNPPASAGNIIPWVRKIPGLGQSPGGGHAALSSILAWQNPWKDTVHWTEKSHTWLKWLSMHARLPKPLSPT